MDQSYDAVITRMQKYINILRTRRRARVSVSVLDLLSFVRSVTFWRKI